MPSRLHDVDEASRAVRGEHMARVLLDLVADGHRVFAVVGSGHVIRQEWALRMALGADPAPDQPTRVTRAGG
jgi:pheromone shutdown protein TraB